MRKKINRIYIVSGIMAFLLLLFAISYSFPYILTNDGDGLGLSLTSLSLGIATVLIVWAIDAKFKVNFRLRHYAFLTFMAASSFVSLYFIFPNYDKFLHFIQPILISSMLFYMMRDLKIDVKWKIVFTFSIMCALTGMWEIAEFGLDRMLDLHLQGVFLKLQSWQKLGVILDPLTDTHMDMVFGNLGAFTYALTTYFYLKLIKKR